MQEAKGRGKRCQSGVKGEAPPFLLPIGDVGTRYLLSMGRTEPPPHGDPPPPPQRLTVVGDKGRPWPGARSGVRGHSFGGGGGGEKGGGAHSVLLGGWTDRQVDG